MLSVILGPEKGYYYIILTYSIAISSLYVVLPISIKAVTDNIIRTHLYAPLVIVTSILFILLIISSVLTALQYYVAEIFQRRFYARLVAEITIRTTYAKYQHNDQWNARALMQKYFEVPSIHKNLPSLLITTFTLVIQIVVGILITSFYHFVYLMFNICIVTLLYFIWKFYAGPAIRAGIDESTCKYETADWLSELGSRFNLLKSNQVREQAIQQSDLLVAEYLDSRKRYFGHSFRQSISLLLLYAIGNATLLLVSGFLVLKGHLTLGQMVATEIILSSILINIAKFGYHLERVYDVIASCHKLLKFYLFPLEKDTSHLKKTHPLPIVFENATFPFKGDAIDLNTTIGPSEHIMIATKNTHFDEFFKSILLGYQKPIKGLYTIDNTFIDQTDIQHHRNKVSFIDSTEIMSLSVRDYLTFGIPESKASKMMEALSMSGLQSRLLDLEDGLDTKLKPNGTPLTYNDLLCLKLTRAIINRSEIIIINHELKSSDMLDRLLAAYCDKHPEVTVIDIGKSSHLSDRATHYYLLDETGLTACSKEVYLNHDATRP